MSKTVFKYFFDPIDHQEKWLNKMASEGFRLVGTTKCTYKFEGCKLDEYEYRVEFVGDKSEGELMKYIDFLDEMG